MAYLVGQNGLLGLDTEIQPILHAKMQAAWQEHVDGAASKTARLPEDVTPDDMKEVYLKAFDLGYKGTTVYREGSRGGQRVMFKCRRPHNARNVEGE